MTLRGSIILSLALHVLLLGTGLAFARFAEGLFRGSREPIIVTLVGKGGNSLTDDGPEKTGKRFPDRSEKKNLPSPRKQVLEKASQAPDAPSVEQNADDGLMSQKTSGDPETKRADSSDGGRSVGAESGSVSSEQWAVIVSSIERVKSYPRLARERGIEGVVRLRFRLKPQGDVEKVEIVKSSGYDILDTASVQTLYRAGPMPYVSGWVEVPIAYVLK